MGVVFWVLVAIGVILTLAVIAVLAAINSRADEDDGHESILILPAEPLGEQVDVAELMRRYE